jgi:hypothetical protein
VVWLPCRGSGRDGLLLAAGRLRGLLVRTPVRTPVVVLADGLVHAIYRKVYLPNYGVFDEQRILEGYVELDMSREQLIAQGLPEQDVDHAIRLVDLPSTSAARLRPASRSPPVPSDVTGGCRSPTATAIRTGPPYEPDAGASPTGRSPGPNWRPAPPLGCGPSPGLTPRRAPSSCGRVSPAPRPAWGRSGTRHCRPRCSRGVWIRRSPTRRTPGDHRPRRASPS